MACSVGSAHSNPRMPVIDWRRVTTWVGLDEVVNAYMATGKRVQMNSRFIWWGVTARCDGWVQMIGRLEYQSWTDKASDEQPSRAVVVASQMLRFATTLLRRRPCGGLADEALSGQVRAELMVRCGRQCGRVSAGLRVQVSGEQP